MHFFLEYISSLIYFAFFLMATIALQMGLNASLGKCKMEIEEQLDLIQAVKVMDEDFHKMGYGKTAPNFVVGKVDSNQVQFFSDVDNNGIVDSVSYYLSDVSDLATTANPNDKILYRRLNNDPPTNVVPGVVDFELSYVDTAGAVMTDAALATTSGLNLVRAVRVKMKLESPFRMDNTYAGTSWQISYAPVNIR